MTAPIHQRVANLKRRQAEQNSILDYVLADAKTVNAKLDGRDKQKLDQYLTSVREIEQRIELTAKMKVQNPEIDAPAGVPVDYAEHVALMFDMLLLAFQTDSTRVATLLHGARRQQPPVRRHRHRLGPPRPHASQEQPRDHRQGAGDRPLVRARGSAALPREDGRPRRTSTAGRCSTIP